MMLLFCHCFLFCSCFLYFIHTVRYLSIIIFYPKRMTTKYCRVVKSSSLCQFLASAQHPTVILGYKKTRGWLNNRQINSQVLPSPPKSFEAPVPLSLSMYSPVSVIPLWVATPRGSSSASGISLILSAGRSRHHPFCTSFAIASLRTFSFFPADL